VNGEDRKKNMRKISIFVVYLVIFYFLYEILVNTKANAGITILVVVICGLIIIAPMIKIKTKNRIYDRMFSKNAPKKEKIDQNKNKKQKTIRFKVKYSPPLIKKCPKCNMMLLKAVIRCPVCSEKIGRYL
jgi:hypothetical protein